MKRLFSDITHKWEREMTDWWIIVVFCINKKSHTQAMQRNGHEAAKYLDIDMNITLSASFLATTIKYYYNEFITEI